MKTATIVGLGVIVTTLYLAREPIRTHLQGDVISRNDAVDGGKSLKPSMVDRPSLPRPQPPKLNADKPVELKAVDKRPENEGSKAADTPTVAENGGNTFRDTSPNPAVGTEEVHLDAPQDAVDIAIQERQDQILVPIEEVQKDSVAKKTRPAKPANDLDQNDSGGLDEAYKEKYDNGYRDSDMEEQGRHGAFDDQIMYEGDAAGSVTEEMLENGEVAVDGGL